jgi:hypothetical protein
MTVNVFVGYDSTQEDAFNVCSYSLKRHGDVNVIPLKQQDLRDRNIYTRDIDTEASTEFSLTRFLVPYLSNYEGFSLFCDSDFLWTENVENVFKQFKDKNKCVMVVKHDYTPKTEIKMDNKVQHKLPRKNWSSMMLFNNSECKSLTPNIVNRATPKYLHQFMWLTDRQIGELSYEYNWLVGYYSETESKKPKAIHYTDGGPWHKGYENCEYSDLWKNEYELYRKQLQL